MADCDSTKCRGSDSLEVIRERTRLATSLLSQAQQLRLGGNVRGVQRLEKKIKAEKSFLESILSGHRPLKEDYFHSSNLTHLQSVLHIAQEIEGLVALQQTFTLVPSLGSTPVSVQVDVVGEGGGRWVRVYCRKRSALHRRWLGDGQFGDKAVSDVATEFIEASRQHQHKFQPPRVSFVFCDGITESISRVLKGSGIEVVGAVFPDESAEEAPPLHCVTKMLREGHSCGEGAISSVLQAGGCATATEHDCVNMDVSSMLAWVSALTHGGEIYTFEEAMLNEQAEQERAAPLWPQLQSATNGKKLVACRSAVDSFSTIVDKVGGENEKARARSLLSMLTVVDDCPSARTMALTDSSKIKHRTKVVFGSGDTLCATTLTANDGFVRASAHQGVHFEVIVHPSRALTEAKQSSCT